MHWGLMCTSPWCLFQAFAPALPPYLTIFLLLSTSLQHPHVGIPPVPLLHLATLPFFPTFSPAFTSCLQFALLQQVLLSTTPLKLFTKVIRDVFVAKFKGQFSVFILQHLTQLILFPWNNFLFPRRHLPDFPFNLLAVPSWSFSASPWTSSLFKICNYSLDDLT